MIHIVALDDILLDNMAALGWIGVTVINNRTWCCSPGKHVSFSLLTALMLAKPTDIRFYHKSLPVPTSFFFFNHKRKSSFLCNNMCVLFLTLIVFSCESAHRRCGLLLFLCAARTCFFSLFFLCWQQFGHQTDSSGGGEILLVRELVTCELSSPISHAVCKPQ